MVVAFKPERHNETILYSPCSGCDLRTSSKCYREHPQVRQHQAELGHQLSWRDALLLVRRRRFTHHLLISFIVCRMQINPLFVRHSFAPRNQSLGVWSDGMTELPCTA